MAPPSSYGASSQESPEQVGRHPLHARVRALGRIAVRLRADVARRGAQAVTPPDGRRIEDDVAFRTGKDYGRVLRVLRAAAAEHRAAGEHFQAGDVGRFAVMFPADEAGDLVAVFQAGAGEEPMALADDR